MKLLIILLSVLVLSEYSFAFVAKSKRQDSSCPSNQFRCSSSGSGSGRCITQTWLCDGDNDCGDNSDEDPETCRTWSCESGQVRCPGSTRCIPQSWLCDGDNDCGDYSDENPAQCGASSQCSPGQVACLGNGRCIPMTWICDGDNDCGDNYDEAPAFCQIHKNKIRQQGGGPDGPSGQQCATSLQMCVMPIASQVQGMQGPQLLQLIRSTPLPQLCEPLLQVHECVSGALESQCASDPALQGNTDMMNSIRALDVTINFVCREHAVELEETKNCLIDNIQQIIPAEQQCLGVQNDAFITGNFQCPTSSQVECAQGVMVEHCGEESGQLIGELDGLVLNEMGCSQKKLKRKHLTKKGVNLKILKKAFKWMF